jgi:hypothetical protein
MNEREWRAARDSRSIRYAGRVLDPERPVLLRADPSYAARYDGQVAVLMAANLLARMTPSVAVDIPAVPLAAPLPWAGRDLEDCALQAMFEADPYGWFAARPARDGDYLIQLGTAGAPVVAHGSNWNIYLGPSPSPVPASTASNPIGPAMAAILAVAAGFTSNLARLPDTVILNARWTGSTSSSSPGGPRLRRSPIAAPSGRPAPAPSARRSCISWRWRRAASCPRCSTWTSCRSTISTARRFSP